MTTNDIKKAITEINELEALMDEVKAQIEALKDSIKAEMTAQNATEMVAEEFIVRWTPVTSNRFDSATFKKVSPEVYKAYLKQTTSKRFTIGKL